MSIKLVCFDLDGVVASTTDAHFVALNDALAQIDKKYIISFNEHLAKYNGLPTTVKLNMLTQEKGLPKELHNAVWELKQQFTEEWINNNIFPDNDKLFLFNRLQNDDIRIAVCSNATRKIVRLILHKMELLQYVDWYFCNTDVERTKPSGEIYLKAILAAKVEPNETVIIEDSHIGRKSALNSGANLLAVNNPDDVNTFNVLDYIYDLNKQHTPRPKWKGGKMNVLIPCAGLGSRFQQANYTFPKPLIETIDGKPMIQLVVENLNIDAHHIFIVQKEHYEKYNLKQLLNLIAPNCDIVQVDGLTEGAACTTLLAKELINNDEPLLIANSDQYVDDFDSNEFLYSLKNENISGGILTFTATHPKWSFVKLNTDGYVERVAEKEPISDIATCGIYYWAKGSEYVKYTEQMINKNIRVNNEFYICPVFNEAIQDNKKIKTFQIKGMHGIGTPEDLQTFLKKYHS